MDPNHLDQENSARGRKTVGRRLRRQGEDTLSNPGPAVDDIRTVTREHLHSDSIRLTSDAEADRDNEVGPVRKIKRNAEDAGFGDAAETRRVGHGVREFEEKGLALRSNTDTVAEEENTGLAANLDGDDVSTTATADSVSDHGSDVMTTQKRDRNGKKIANEDREGSLPPVMNEDLQATDLADTYVGLPALRPAQLIPANDTETLNGFFKFRLWKFILPRGVEASQIIKKAIVFDIKGSYFNPARAAPSSVAVAALGPSGSQFVVRPSNKTACMMAVTTGCCTSSEVIMGHINSFKSETSTISKRVTIIPHSQEFERFVAFLGMVFGFKSLRAPCYSDYSFTFSTRAATLDDKGPKVVSTRLQNYLSRHLASDVTSPAISRGSSSGTNIRASLGPHDNVPVYDARNSTFSLQDSIEEVSRLPLYEGGHRDLPEGSCVTVGHTVGIYSGKEGVKNLTLNLHWIILWAIPQSASF